jgi:hypothetical protein
MGAVPEDASLKADPKHMARMDVDFTQPAGQQALESRTDFPSYDWAAAPAFGAAPVARGPRTEWGSAGDGITWQQTAWVSGWLGAQSEPATYAPRSTHEERWFAPVVRPRMTRDMLPTRDETTLSLVVHGFGDSGQAHIGDGQSPKTSSTVSLYQGDRQLLQSTSPYVYAGDLSSESLPYRLVDETTGDPAFSPYSSRTRTEWDFTSGTEPSGTPVPLVQLDYGIALDAAGRAGSRPKLTITPSVPGAAPGDGEMSSVRLEVSYDDGATWQPQALTEAPKNEQGRRASLHAPSGARFVSLRTTAKAAAGGSVTQTVVRAFGLR